MYCANLGCWQTENCLLHQTLEYDNQSDESEGEGKLYSVVYFKLFLGELARSLF